RIIPTLVETKHQSGGWSDRVQILPAGRELDNDRGFKVGPPGTVSCHTSLVQCLRAHLFQVIPAGLREESLLLRPTASHVRKILTENHLSAATLDFDFIRERAMREDF